MAFSVSSLLAALLIGVALGNIVWGIPLDRHHEFLGNLLTLLHPYPLFVGLTAVALMVMHGNIYLVLKTEGALQEKLRGWTRRTIPFYLACFLVLNVVTVFFCPHIEAALRQRPVLLGLLFLLTTAVTLNIPREARRGHEGRAFVSSCLSIVTLMLLFGASVYPTMVFSTPEIAHSLTIYNGSSTDKTLGFMFVVAMIGVPIVLAYTAGVYYVFRGKVRITEGSY